MSEGTDLLCFGNIVLIVRPNIVLENAAMSSSHEAASSVLIAETQGEVVHLTLNRPERRNALSHELLQALDTALARVAEDNRIRAVVIAARGPAFCAGHDLGEMIGRATEDYRELFSLCSAVMLRLRRLPQPVIARVHGLATAAGTQLVAACDLAVAADTATFATPGVKIGLFCTTPMIPMVRAIPAKPAMEMLLTGKQISAQRAWELGLINRVVPTLEIDAAVQEFLDAILASSPLTIRLGKAAFYQQQSLDERAAYDLATNVMIDNAQLADAQEGMNAFLHKRRPVWTGN
jgi:enoyl-CoA hydratase/carnithine racemase